MIGCARLRWFIEVTDGSGALLLAQQLSTTGGGDGRNPHCTRSSGLLARQPGYGLALVCFRPAKSIQGRSQLANPRLKHGGIRFSNRIEQGTQGKGGRNNKLKHTYSSDVMRSVLAVHEEVCNVTSGPTNKNALNANPDFGNRRSRDHADTRVCTGASKADSARSWVRRPD